MTNSRLNCSRLNQGEKIQSLNTYDTRVSDLTNELAVEIVSDHVTRDSGPPDTIPSGQHIFEGETNGDPATSIQVYSPLPSRSPQPDILEQLSKTLFGQNNDTKPFPHNLDGQPIQEPGILVEQTKTAPSPSNTDTSVDSDTRNSESFLIENAIELFVLNSVNINSGSPLGSDYSEHAQPLVPSLLMTTAANNFSSSSAISSVSLFLQNCINASPLEPARSYHEQSRLRSPSPFRQDRATSPLPPSSPVQSSSPAPFFDSSYEPLSPSSQPTSAASQDKTQDSTKECASTSLSQLAETGEQFEEEVTSENDLLVASSPGLPPSSLPPSSDFDINDYETSTTYRQVEKEQVTQRQDSIKLGTHRPTEALHRQQRKKLAAPFRSPIINTAKAASGGQVTPLESSPQLVPQSMALPEITSKQEDAKVRHRTARAAAQFKSPLTGTAPNVNNTIRLTPMIQALERKIQNLKRAIKVKERNEQVELTLLVKRWREAGQEIAYEVWSIARDRAQSETLVAGGSWGWNAEAKGDNIRKLDDNWGWAEQGDQKKPCLEEEREKVIDIDIEESERPRETLGTMLRQLGIAPETLGWDEKVECFT